MMVLGRILRVTNACEMVLWTTDGSSDIVLTKMVLENEHKRVLVWFLGVQNNYVWFLEVQRVLLNILLYQLQPLILKFFSSNIKINHIDTGAKPMM